MQSRAYDDFLTQLANGVAFFVAHLDEAYLQALGITAEAAQDFHLVATLPVSAADPPRIRNLKALLNCAYHLNSILTRLNHDEYKIKIVAMELVPLLRDLRHLKIGADVDLIKTFLTKNYQEFYEALAQVAPKIEVRLGMKQGALEGNNNDLVELVADAHQPKAEAEFSNVLLEAMAKIDEYIVEKAEIALPKAVEYFEYHAQDDVPTRSLKAVLNIMRRTGRIINILETGVEVAEDDTWATIKKTEGYRYYNILQHVMAISTDFDLIDKDYVTVLFQKLFDDSLEKAKNLLFKLAVSIDQFEIDMGLRSGTIFDKFRPVYEAYFKFDPAQNWATLHAKRIESLETTRVVNISEMARRDKQLHAAAEIRKELLAHDAIKDPAQLDESLINKLCEFFDIDVQAENKIAQLVQLGNEKLREQYQQSVAHQTDAAGVLGYLGQKRRQLANFVYHQVGFTADFGYEFCHQLAAQLDLRQADYHDELCQIQFTQQLVDKRVDEFKHIQVKAEAKPWVAPVERPILKIYQNHVEAPAPAPARHVASPHPQQSESGLKQAFKIIGEVIRAFFIDLGRSIANFFRKIFGIKPPVKSMPKDDAKMSSYAYVLTKAPAKDNPVDKPALVKKEKAVATIKDDETAPLLTAEQEDIELTVYSRV